MFQFEDQLTRDFMAQIAEDRMNPKHSTAIFSSALPTPFSGQAKLTKTPVISKSSKSKSKTKNPKQSAGGGSMDIFSKFESEKKQTDGNMFERSGDPDKKSKKRKGKDKDGSDNDDDGDGEDGEEDSAFDRSKKVKIKGFKDIGEKKYYRDMFSICWSNSALGRKILGNVGSGKSSVMVPPDMKVQQSERSPYKVYGKDNWFGNVRIVFIEPTPTSRGSVKVIDVNDADVDLNLKNGAESEMSSQVYEDLHCLLTKRIQKNRVYSKESRDRFSEIVKVSGLPIMKSAKYSFVKGSGDEEVTEEVEGKGLEFDEKDEIVYTKPSKSKAGKLGKAYLSVDNDVMMTRPKDFKSGVAEFNLHYGTIKGGNRNKDLVDKIKLIYKYLWSEASKTTKNHDYFMKNVHGKYVDVIRPF